MKAKSVKISSETHFKLRLLALWLEKEKIMDSPTVDDMICDMMDHYISSKYPEAGKFINFKL